MRLALYAAAGLVVVTLVVSGFSRTSQLSPALAAREKSMDTISRNFKASGMSRLELSSISASVSGSASRGSRTRSMLRMVHSASARF